MHGGRGVRTVLIVAQGEELKFDDRSQRYLAFRSIRHLEELLAKELSALTAESHADIAAATDIQTGDLGHQLALETKTPPPLHIK